jgi:hypothetical protein
MNLHYKYQNTEIKWRLNMDFNAEGVQNNGHVRNVPPPSRGGVSPARRMFSLAKNAGSVECVEQFGLYRIDTSSKVGSYPTRRIQIRRQGKLSVIWKNT